MEKIKTYRCKNDECPVYVANLKKGIKKRKTLCKGVITGDSFVEIECPACRRRLEINMEVKEKVDNEEKRIIELLTRGRSNAGA